jgi:large subunit ribosomal protein L18
MTWRLLTFQLKFYQSLQQVLNGNDQEIVGAIGKTLAEKSIAAMSSANVVVKAHYLYHGRVKNLAEGAREVGLKF